MIGRSWAVRARVVAVLAMGLVGAMNTGCGDGDFVSPPPPVESGDAVGSREVAPKAGLPTTGAGLFGRIDYIRSRRTDPVELAVELAAARTQAGLDKARLHVRPDDDAAGAPETSAARDKSQADLIRASIAQKPSVLIVDPDDPADAELARAVREARAARIPVVVVGRPLAGAGEAKAPELAPMVLVAPTPFIASARRIVELSLRNLKHDKFDPAGRAVILVTDPADRLIGDRAAAIRQALAEAKITTVSELVVPKDLEAASSDLKKRLQEDGKLVLVFFTDYSAALVANHVAEEISEKRPFVEAGYSADEARTRWVMAGYHAAIGEYEPSRLIRKAVSVAIATARGRESREKEEIPITVLESPATSGVARARPQTSRMFKDVAPEADKKSE